MAKANPLDGKLKTLAVIIAVVVIAGYIGDWYAENNGGVSCKLGVGGECGAIGSCDEYCDMKEVEKR